MNNLDLIEFRKIKKITQKQLAELVNVSERTVQNWESGRVIPKTKHALLRDLLNSTLDYNEEKSEESILGDKLNRHQIPIQKITDTIYIVTAPLVKYTEYSQNVQKFKKDEQEKSFETNAVFTVNGYPDGNYIAFEVVGVSMFNNTYYDIPDGAIVLGDKRNKEEWEKGFEESERGWVVITSTSIMFKDIVGFDKKENTITLHSRNPSPEFQDFKLSLNDINYIYKIVRIST